MAPLHKVLTVLALAFAAAFILLRLADWPGTQGLTTLCVVVAIFVGAGAFAASHQRNA